MSEYWSFKERLRGKIQDGQFTVVKILNEDESCIYVEVAVWKHRKPEDRVIEAECGSYHTRVKRRQMG